MWWTSAFSVLPDPPPQNLTLPGLGLSTPLAPLARGVFFVLRGRHFRPQKLTQTLGVGRLRPRKRFSLKPHLNLPTKTYANESTAEQGGRFLYCAAETFARRNTLKRWGLGGCGRANVFR